MKRNDRFIDRFGIIIDTAMSNIDGEIDKWEKTVNYESKN
jgi:hypothetical protein